MSLISTSAVHIGSQQEKLDPKEQICQAMRTTDANEKTIRPERSPLPRPEALKADLGARAGAGT